MSKTEIKIEGMPERGVGKRVFREYLVVYADDKDGKTYPVYINSSLVVKKRFTGTSKVGSYSSRKIWTKSKQFSVSKNGRG